MRLAFVLLVSVMSGLAHANPVQWWVSAEGEDAGLQPGAPLVWETAADGEAPDIAIDPSKTYQEMLGLGASFEHATCYNLSRLPQAERSEAIRKLVDPDAGIGMSLMRLCIGTSDFAGDPWYSYADVPEGESDPELASFTIGKDRVYVLPVIKEAQAIQPDLKFFASVWSPPAWMKLNGKATGGKLDPQWYDAFSRYLIKFIHAYAAEGVPVLAITPQNEPHFPNPAYPTCGYKAEEMLTLIRDHVGPRLRSEAPGVALWCWDHNWNEPEFPRTILSDPTARELVDGVAWHFYEGKPDAQTLIHNEFPEKGTYFTEGSTFRTRGAVQIVEILRNWARSYNAWVVMLDADRKPNNGPHNASQTCIELLRDGTVRYNFDYYMYGQFMKFIRPGAVRLDSTEGTVRFANVAFKNTDGKHVAVVANASAEPKSFSLGVGGKMVKATLPKRAVGTFVWE